MDIGFLLRFESKETNIHEHFNHCMFYCKHFIPRKRSRLFSEVSPSSYLGQTEDFAGNLQPVNEVCDSKSGKSVPIYCFKGTPLRYRHPGEHFLDHGEHFCGPVEPFLGFGEHF